MWTARASTRATRDTRLQTARAAPSCASGTRKHNKGYSRRLEDALPSRVLHCRFRTATKLLVANSAEEPHCPRARTSAMMAT
jgi:hypothetical protein